MAPTGFPRCSQPTYAARMRRYRTTLRTAPAGDSGLPPPACVGSTACNLPAQEGCGRERGSSPCYLEINPNLHLTSPNVSRKPSATQRQQWATQSRSGVEAPRKQADTATATTHIRGNARKGATGGAPPVAVATATPKKASERLGGRVHTAAAAAAPHAFRQCIAGGGHRGRDPDAGDILASLLSRSSLLAPRGLAPHQLQATEAIRPKRALADLPPRGGTDTVPHTADPARVLSPGSGLNSPAGLRAARGLLGPRQSGPGCLMTHSGRRAPTDKY